MKIKRSFATGRCPDAVQRADSAGRPLGETIVSRQAQKSISARPEAMLKNHAVDFSTLSGRPNWFTAGGIALECIEFSFSTVSASALTNFGSGAHSRRSNPMDNSDLSAFSRGDKMKINGILMNERHINIILL